MCILCNTETLNLEKYRARYGVDLNCDNNNERVKIHYPTYSNDANITIYCHNPLKLPKLINMNNEISISLHLENSDIEDFNFNFVDYVNGNNIKRVTIFIKDCPNLRTIKADTHQFIEIHDCPNLVDVNILNSDVNIKNCKNLKGVNVSNCEFNEEIEIINCENLKQVKMLNCEELTYVGFYNCENLENISFALCDKVTLRTIINCDNLKSINLTDCSVFEYTEKDINKYENNEDDIIKISNTPIFTNETILKVIENDYDNNDYDDDGDDGDYE